MLFRSQRKLGVQSVIFALLATTFCGVVWWQMNRKINEVRVDYESVVVRKQAAQNMPKVTESTGSEQSSSVVVVHSEPTVQLTQAKDEKAK